MLPQYSYSTSKYNLKSAKLYIVGVDSVPTKVTQIDYYNYLRLFSFPCRKRVTAILLQSNLVYSRMYNKIGTKIEYVRVCPRLDHRKRYLISIHTKYTLLCSIQMY